MILYRTLSYQVMGAVFTIHKSLGPGLLEKPYQKALEYQLKQKGLKVHREVPFPVIHDGIVFGEYFADIVVENKIILEVKSVENLNKVMEKQLLNYLHISNLRLGILINFSGMYIQSKRIVHFPP